MYLYMHIHTLYVVHNIVFTLLLMQAELEDLQHRAPEIAGRLVTRPQDMEKVVEQHIQHYRENMLRNLEDFIIQHNQQHVIELDANLSSKELFRVLSTLYIHVHVHSFITANSCMYM